MLDKNSKRNPKYTIKNLSKEGEIYEISFIQKSSENLSPKQIKSIEPIVEETPKDLFVEKSIALQPDTSDDITNVIYEEPEKSKPRGMFYNIIELITLMDYQFNCTENYGFFISKIFGKELSLMTEQDYKSLNQCENIEEFCIKLSRKYKYISEDMEHTKNELKRRLNQTLIDEYNECRKEDNELLSKILDCYIENHSIHNFFYLLQCKSSDPDLEKSFDKIEIGDFDALRTLKFCKDMHDVQKYCVENSFIKKYFYKVKWAPEFKDNDFQKYQALFLKYHVEDAFSKLKDDIFLEEILKTEADRYIIDLTINTLNSKDIIGLERKLLFPTIYSLDPKIVDELSNSESLEDIKTILNDKYNFSKDIYTELIKREIKKYTESFKLHNDLSCVYSYLRLREQEIKNILWIVECVLQDRKEESDHFLVIK